jgi:hypothetical protein
MSKDLHRRRRLTPSGPRRSSGGSNGTSWAITIAAAVAVIIGGWFLGQGLAHWLSPGEQRVAQAPTSAPTIVASPLPSPTQRIAATAAPSPSAQPTILATRTASPTASPRRTFAPSAPPTVVRTIAPTLPPTTVLTAAPTQRPRTTLPVARRPETTPPPAPAIGENPASAAVRSYIDALRRGDPQTAATYLGNGAPDEDFIDASTRITSVNTTRNPDGSYKVAVDMQTSKGEYYETFIVASAPSGARILEKAASKP